MKLLIIEGAGKKQTIEKYLGSGFKVFATKGHIRDLPVKSLAVDVKNNFAPKYTILEEKEEIVNSLKAVASKADEIFLATDPDREGEAISWHVAHILDLDTKKPIRIIFNEISKKAISGALENPKPINQNLVDAQQARRVLDRLVGYKVSPVLCKKIQNKLSAGRVQSVTLRLVVDREREIRAFIPEEYWPFFAILEKNGEKNKIKASLDKHNGEKIKLTNKEAVDKVLADIKGKEYKVIAVKKSVTKTRPPAPFITSSLQQDALNKLGFSLKQTQSISQALYEGVEIGGEGKVALVTYIRTDSTRVAPDAIAAAREFISSEYGKDYIPEKPNFYASKKGAQDAHEAIRPISVIRTPESVKSYIDKNQYKLYKLIYERFLASQMSEATYNSMQVDIACGDYNFRASGRTPLFLGYTKIYEAFDYNKKDDDANEKNAKLPELVEGDVLNLDELKYEQKFTKPPARYTEATLVKAMEEKGIGRPATYTQTIVTIVNRAYVEKEQKSLKATELGEKVCDMLVKYFPDIMDVKFTANMEEELDTIEDGGIEWQGIIAKFYEGFEDKIKAAVGDDYTLKIPPKETDIICENCGNKFLLRQGRFGPFLGCSGFPKCKTIKQVERPTATTLTEEGFEGLSVPPDTNSSTEVAATAKVELKAPSGVSCDKCGLEMVEKSGRYGPFLACPGYPQCKNIKNIENPNEKPAGNCPQCKKPLRKMKSKRGNDFYGCTGYPDCKFISNFPVAESSCTKCGSYMVIKKDEAKCSNKECK